MELHLNSDSSERGGGLGLGLRFGDFLGEIAGAGLDRRGLSRRPWPWPSPGFGGGLGGGFGGGLGLGRSFAVGADQEGSFLGHFLQQVGAAAFGAGFGDRLGGGGEVALGILVAAVEEVAAAGFLLDDLAGFAGGALDADQVLLDVFALGVAGAGDELAEASVAQQEIASAVGTFFVERGVGLLLHRVEAAGGFALGIAGAGHEGAEASALEDHGLAAVFAELLLVVGGDFGVTEVGEVDGIFLGEGAGVGVLLVEGGAGEKRAVLAPLEDQGRAAPLTLLVGGLLHALDVFHVLAGVFEVLFELGVELVQGVGPLDFAFLDLVELLFHAGGELVVEDVLEIFDQQFGDDEADLGGEELSAAAGGLLHVAAIDDGAHDGGVGGGTADAALLQFLDQRGFVEARRRLGEMLLGLERFEAQRLALLQRRQLVLERLVFIVLGLLGFFVDLEEAFELEDRSGDAEVVAGGGVRWRGTASISTVVWSKTAAVIWLATKRCQMSL